MTKDLCGVSRVCVCWRQLLSFSPHGKGPQLLLYRDIPACPELCGLAWATAFCLWVDCKLVYSLGLFLSCSLLCVQVLAAGFSVPSLVSALETGLLVAQAGL